MKNLTRAIQELVEWHPVGVALEIPHHKLDAINISQHSIPLCKVIIVCCFSVCHKLVLCMISKSHTSVHK